jgi:hypothetical protein
MDNFLNIASLPLALTLPQVLVTLALSFILSLSVAYVYKATHKGLSYSQSFTFTLVMIGFLISVIMMIIGNSLAIAFGAFGAFSLIRFRTAIKDTRDLAFILLAVAIGLATGTGNFLIAVITTVAAIAIIYGLYKVNFGSIRKYDFILNFSANTDKFSNDQLRALYKKYLKYDNLLNVKSQDSGQVMEYSFNIKFIAESDLAKFSEKLSSLEGVSDVDIISSKNDIEY